MLLKEIFDNPLPYHRIIHHDWQTATFTAGEATIQVDFMKKAALNASGEGWSVMFDDVDNEEEFKLTNRHRDQIKILSTVNNIIKTFISENPQVKTLYFNIDKNEKSRNGLYIRMIERLAGELGVKYKKGSAGKYNNITIILKENMVTEVFDKPFDYKWIDIADTEWFATFRTSDETSMVVKFFDYHRLKKSDPIPKRESDTWAVVFGLSYTDAKYFDLTHKNTDQFRILSTVINIIQDFIRKNPEIDKLTVSYNKHEGREGSRAKLYDKILERIIKQTGYKYSVENKGSSKFKSITLDLHS
jgi:hypothetical protein